MNRFKQNLIGGCLLVMLPVFGKAAISASVRESSATSVETKIVFALEQTRSEINFCKTNRGRAFDEVDMSKIGNVGAYGMRVKVVTDGLVASKYEWYGDFSKAADYYYKDYLVQIGKRPWKSTHSWSSPGDSTPFPLFMETLRQNQDYQRMVKVYPEYFNYYFNLHYYKGSEKEKIQRLKKEMEDDSELKNQYDTFMQEWREAKKLAKTTKPKPLDPAVQHHGWFYSDKQAEVLKALAYYHQHNVRFMLEKASGHKDPVIAAKAKEYLQNPVKEAAGDETKK